MAIMKNQSFVNTTYIRYTKIDYFDDSLWNLILRGGNTMNTKQTIKPRHVGNSTVLTVPTTIKIDENVRYFVTKGADGAIVFMPQIANPFEEPELRQQITKQKSEFENVKPEGRENDE